MGQPKSGILSQLKSGIPEMSQLKSGIPETSQLKSGIPKMGLPKCTALHTRPLHKSGYYNSARVTT